MSPRIPCLLCPRDFSNHLDGAIIADRNRELPRKKEKNPSCSQDSEREKKVQDPGIGVSTTQPGHTSGAIFEWRRNMLKAENANKHASMSVGQNRTPHSQPSNSISSSSNTNDETASSRTNDETVYDSSATSKQISNGNSSSNLRDDEVTNGDNSSNEVNNDGSPPMNVSSRPTDVGLLTRISGKIDPKSPFKLYKSSSELDAILDIMIINDQKTHFIDEYTQLQQEEDVGKNSHIYALSPFLEEGIIKMQTRLAYSDLLPEQMKYPIILAKKSRLAELIIMDSHIQQLHAGPEQTKRLVRNKYWVVGGKRGISTVIKNVFTNNVCQDDSNQ